VASKSDLCDFQTEAATTVKMSRKEMKKAKKMKQYAEQLEAVKLDDQFTLSQVDKTSKNTALTDNALDIKVKDNSVCRVRDVDAENQ